MSNIVLGIDLGTTYSAAAYVNADGQPEVIRNADGQTTTPSVVLIQDGRTAVGEMALNQWVTNEEHVVRWIKRSMDDATFRFQGLSPIEISAEILKSLKADAEAQLGEPLAEAVITCPAYFAAIEIENTRHAGELAGFRVREIIKEPTAAAVYHGVENMKDGETVLVCDLGGGTFDATVLTYHKRVFQPLATLGDRKLGGHDWTMDLVELVAERFQQQYGDDPRNDLVAGQLLYEACEKAKRDFARIAVVTIPCQYQQRLEQVAISRDDFEARTEWLIGQVVQWAERALAKAEPPLDWGQIDRILLVGGSSRLRRVGEALQQASGKAPVQVRDPDLAVAYGAAILARGKVKRRRPPGGLVEVTGGLVEVVARRTLTRSVGTRALVWDGGRPRIQNALLLPHGTELPVSRSRQDFEVAVDRQEFFEVPVVEFETDTDENYELVGNFRCKCLPGAKRGDRIKVTVSYDTSGIPTVEAFDQRSGTRLAVERDLHYTDPDPKDIPRVAARWVVFAVDVSFSMGGHKLTNAKKAVLHNAKLLRNASSTCQIGLVSFGAQATVLCRPTADLAALDRAVNSMVPSGTTAMDQGIQEALDLVLSAPPGTDRDIVVLTDGMPDEECRDETLAAAEQARRQGVTLSSLGVGSEYINLEFLKTLTPLALVIETAEGMAEGMSKLLALSAARRGGLTEK